ncbi:MAG: adenylate/guanylate cyclase domain-containing protein [Acidimicrobiales bacterium]
MASREEFEAAGLFDPAVDAGTGRLELLEWLDRRGFSVADMVAAHHRSGLGSLAGDARLGSGDRLPTDLAIAASGLSPHQFEGIATAFGFAPGDTGDFGLTEAEAVALSIYTGLSDMFSPDEALGFVRVLGSSMARIGEAAVSLFLTDVEGPLLASRASELELAQKVLESVELLDGFVPMLDPVLRRHVLQAIERGRLAIIDEFERLQYRYAVGFVDLVGFTPISQDMSAQQLGIFLREFEATAHDTVTKAGARLVKLIGDEVMFVAPDADSACMVARALMSEVATESGHDVLPRGGLAYGEVLVRGGDYHGAVVNLASRLVDEAVPRELLVTEALAEGSELLDFEPAGRRMLKGFAEPVAVWSASFAADPKP